MRTELFLIVQVAIADKPLSLFAFGDWGGSGKTTRTNLEGLNAYLLRTQHDGVMLLGDNFYPDGIDPKLGVSDPRFDMFSTVLAKNLDTTPFYTVLGNHDIRQGPYSRDPQMEYAKIQSNWVMPSRNYFVRLYQTTCIWFIDTSEAIVHDMKWLVDSLTIGTSNNQCMWRILATHYPVVTKGVYRRNKGVGMIRSQLMPLINSFGIHLYLSGHEHNSQALSDDEMLGGKAKVLHEGVIPVIPE